MASDAESKITVAYGSWAATKKFVEQLHATVLPQVIDSSVMSRMSGSARSEVRTALRFLRWTTDSGAVTPIFKSVVEDFGNKDSWPLTLAGTVVVAYRPILADLDLETSTLRQLLDKFRENANVSGSVLRKAVRFFLSMAGEAQIVLSPHFNARGLTAMTSDRPRAKPTKPTTRTLLSVPGSGNSVTVEKTSDIGTRREFPIPGLTEKLVVYFPTGLSTENWDFIAPYVRAFVQHDEKERQDFPF